MAIVKTSASQFVLHIFSDKMPVDELANLISALNGSFAAFSPGRPKQLGRPHLAVRAVEHGSIVLIFEAVEGFGKVMAAGTLIAPWASHIADLAKWWVLAQPPKLSPADRKVAEAISHPVANGHSTQINIVYNGNVVLNVGPVEAGYMAQALRTARHRVAATMPPEPAQVLNEEHVAQLESGLLNGTALFVDNLWYARLENLRGVLVPIHQSGTSHNTLVHGLPYRFAGTPERGSHGEIVGISLANATPLGRR